MCAASNKPTDKATPFDCHPQNLHDYPFPPLPRKRGGAQKPDLINGSGWTLEITSHRPNRRYYVWPNIFSRIFAAMDFPLEGAKTYKPYGHFSNKIASVCGFKFSQVCREELIVAFSFCYRCSFVYVAFFCFSIFLMFY